jgi:predicted DNA-binding transcriptional regulator YafY
VGHESDGRYAVTYNVADVGWFVREVLQCGDDAEVLEPPSLWDAVKASQSSPLSRQGEGDRGVWA